MQTTAEEVKVLEAELYVLKPHLEKAAKEASEMLAKINADTVMPRIYADTVCFCQLTLHYDNRRWLRRRKRLWRKMKRSRPR